MCIDGRQVVARSVDGALPRLDVTDEMMQTTIFLAYSNSHVAWLALHGVRSMSCTPFRVVRWDEHPIIIN